ncbi:hypothetical protein GCM10023081_20240 [Arthrobacter ginkgonis]|uniref:Flp pilus-assembly TadG-like N-terminal domain-containing protein n=1 Tax=Arthrobacter ginkgonis TaxID=1630594 RepID=A0ABP7C735_9MICC
MSRAPVPATGEEGRILVLAAGYVSIALLAVSGTLAATAVTTEARRLLSVADGAATAAADRYTVAQGQGEGTGAVGLVLTDAAVRAAALEYARDTGATVRFDGFTVLSAGADPAGSTAHIRLGATVHPPIVGWFVPAGIPISVESNARTILTR